MPVGIVADKASVLQPDHALGTQILLQALFYLLLGQRLVAVGGHQTATGGEDSASSVALDAATLEHKVQVRLVAALDQPLLVQVLVDLVVQLGRKLLAPPVELEVEQNLCSVGLLDGDESVVAGPGVVVRNVVHHQHWFALLDFTRHLFIDGCDFCKHGSPVRSFVRPRQLHTTLRFPFGHHSST